jgi:hypothetical protein
MCCLCIQFTRENTSEGTILHLVKKQDPLSKVWLLALQKRLATPLGDIRGADNVTADASGLVTGFLSSDLPVFCLFACFCSLCFAYCILFKLSLGKIDFSPLYIRRFVQVILPYKLYLL